MVEVFIPSPNFFDLFLTCHIFSESVCPLPVSEISELILPIMLATYTKRARFACPFWEHGQAINTKSGMHLAHRYSRHWSQYKVLSS